MISRAGTGYATLMLASLLPVCAWANDENATEQDSRLEFNSLLEVEWAYGTVDKINQKQELVFEPEMDIELNENSKITTIARLRTDAVDRLEPGDSSHDEVSAMSRHWLIGDNSDVELRELYVESEIGEAFFILGKQQIVWGKADGLKVLDVVNPQNFREFILDDFDDSRIPLWSLNAEIPVNDSVLQLIWIPDKTYNVLPVSDSLYAFTSTDIVPVVPSGVAVDLRPVDKPDRFFADADYGLRVTSFVGGWDLTINYFYHFNDTPVLFRTLSSGAQPKVIMTPRYKRSRLFGGTFSNAFGGFVLRGEIGYSTDRYFLTNNVSDSDGITKSNELAYVLGLDWSGIDDTFLSAQLFQSRLTDNQLGLVRAVVDTTMTFLARRDFMNETVVAEVLWLHNLNHDDGLIRAKLSYEWSDTVKVLLGADIFYGNEAGVFGQFDRNDRLTVGVEWGV